MTGRRSILSKLLLIATSCVVASGCFFLDFGPVGPDMPLRKPRLAGTWRVSMAGQDNMPGTSSVKLNRQALMIQGNTFVDFNILGDFHYVGTLSADQEVGLWEINLSTRVAAAAITTGLPDTGPIVISEIQASVVNQKEDGTITASMSWRRGPLAGGETVDVAVVFEQMRFGLVRNQMTAVMTRTESSSTDPAPQRSRLVGEVVLERIEPEIRELTGDISPAGRIIAVPGPLPPYNEGVAFQTGQYFALRASDTTGPPDAELSYYWHVIREVTDAVTNQVTQRERVLVVPGQSSGFVAATSGRFYVTLYVTDGVLWRSTQVLGEASEQTRFVKVE